MRKSPTRPKASPMRKRANRSAAQPAMPPASDPPAPVVRLPLASLRLHDAWALVPGMQPDEWEIFLADVLANGVRDPIVVQRGGIVLDGRHRLKAAGERGDEFILARVVDLDGQAQLDYLLKAAVLRRHLNDSQRAMLAAKIKPAYEKAAKKRQEATRIRNGRVPAGADSPPPDQKGKSRDQAGAACGVSGRSVDHATKALSKGTPELARAVAAGELRASTAAKLTELPAEEQKRALLGGKAAIRAAVATADNRPEARFHRIVHNLIRLMRSTHNAGGIVALVASWSAEGRAEYAAKLREHHGEVGKWIELLEQDHGRKSHIKRARTVPANRQKRQGLDDDR